MGVGFWSGLKLHFTTVFLWSFLLNQTLEMTFESQQTRVFLQQYLVNQLITTNNVYSKIKILQIILVLLNDGHIEFKQNLRKTPEPFNEAASECMSWFLIYNNLFSPVSSFSSLTPSSFSYPSHPLLPPLSSFPLTLPLSYPSLSPSLSLILPSHPPPLSPSLSLSSFSLILLSHPPSLSSFSLILPSHPPSLSHPSLSPSLSSKN